MESGSVLYSEDTASSILHHLPVSSRYLMSETCRWFRDTTRRLFLDVRCLAMFSNLQGTRGYTMVVFNNGKSSIWGSDIDGGVPISASADFPVESVHGGSNSASGTDSSGAVWVWNANTEPTRARHARPVAEINDLFCVQTCVQKHRVTCVSANIYNWVVVCTTEGKTFALSGPLGGRHGVPLRKPQLIRRWIRGDGTSLTESEVFIRKVVCGRQSMFAVSRDGELYAWGSSSTATLGLGEKTMGGSGPRQVMFEARRDVRIKGVSSQGSHTVAWSEDGEAFTWGYGGSTGHLGCEKSPLIAFTPMRITRLRHANVVGACTGDLHTLLWTDKGDLYVCGWNLFGQLGIRYPGQCGAGDLPSSVDGASSSMWPESVPLPTLHTVFNADRGMPVGHCVADHHVTFVHTQRGHLYAFGDNRSSQIRSDMPLCCFDPVRLDFCRCKDGEVEMKTTRHDHPTTHAS